MRNRTPFRTKKLQRKPCALLNYNLIFGGRKLGAERTVVHRGKMYKIAFARDHEGASPAEEFFDGLSMVEKAQLSKLFQILGDDTHGEPRNPKKFGVLDDGLYEFKSF